MVIPAHGLDIGEVVVGGIRVDWASPAGGIDHREGTRASSDWLTEFHGGLVATCGLNNVGSPSEGYGLHGSFALTAAHDVGRRVEQREEGSVTVVTGHIADGALECFRTVEIRTTELAISIVDVVKNVSATRVQAPFLYHVNWGAPFLGDALELRADVTSTVARDEGSTLGDADWRRPSSAEQGQEIVVEHLGVGDAAPDRVELINAQVGIRATMTWTGLDRLHQWIDLSDARGVLAVEPANCSVLGREHDRAVGNAPYLRAGEARTTSLVIRFDFLA